MNPRVAILPTLLLLMFVAAPLAAGQASAPPNPPDPHIADGSLQRRLDDARHRWKAANVHSYRFELQQGCFCPPQTSRLVVVRGGVPKRWPSGMKSVATVPRLFRLIQGAIDGRAARITAVYGKRGVPREIYVDRAVYIADEEIGYSTSRFTPLS